ncbi:MAG TPA: hypothetical protein EYH54_01865 [Nautiliaceae bacterium]|nr:hypothetical protein [Nautiliaceae bacterium]
MSFRAFFLWLFFSSFFYFFCRGLYYFSCFFSTFFYNFCFFSNNCSMNICFFLFFLLFGH